MTEKVQNQRTECWRCCQRYFLTVLLSLLTFVSAGAQDHISLEDCYRLARENYPAIKKLDLIAKTSDYNVENANRKFLPQISFSGQATYQSQTINFGEALGALPNVKLPVLSKDQYKLQGEADQLLYDGGANHYQKELTRANAELQKQQIEVNLYALKQRINDIFFSVLLMEAQIGQNDLNRSNLHTQAKKTEVSIANGVSFQSNLDELNAEIVDIDMSSTEYRANRLAYLKMLALYTGKPIDSTVQLDLPPVGPSPASVIRPELKEYDLQKAAYDLQEKQLRSDYRPTVSAFFQGAYGRPTLNIIDNSFGAWYFTGVRFNWSLGSLYTLSNQKKILEMNRQSTDADRNTFLLNTQLDLTQQDAQAKEYGDLIVQDQRAILLRQAVSRSAAAQLDNGVITTHEYIQKTNAENLARQMLILHQIQRLQAQYNEKFTSGN